MQYEIRRYGNPSHTGSPADGAVTGRRVERGDPPGDPTARDRSEGGSGVCKQHGSAVENCYVGVRDCPYGICCPWVRGGWDLDALGKFFRRRRRRRRRRPRPLLLRQFLEKVVIFSHFS